MNLTKEETLENILTGIKSTWVLDTLYLFILAPLGLIGILLNAITLVILNDSAIPNTSFYKYMKAFVMNSLIICLNELLFVFTQTQRYVFTINFFIVRLYTCSLDSILTSGLLNFGNILNILITTERMSAYVPKFYNFKRINPKKIMISLFVLNLVICGPTALTQIPSNDQEFRQNFSTCKKSQLSATIYGTVLFFLSFMFIYMVTFLVEIIASIVAIIQFKKYLKRIFENNLKLEAVGRVWGAYEVESGENKGHDLSEIDKNLTRLSIFSSIFSVIFNFSLLLVMVAYLTLGADNYTFYFIIALQKFFTFLRHGTNIFNLYFYNQNFRSMIKNRFKVTG